MYKRFNWLSIFFIFMLFVIGGLVRSTGSGMGCPDWPKCFGEYVPPTSVDQLPDNYEDYFTQQRIEKTQRFASLLEKLGFEEEAKSILNNPQIEGSHQYNTAKAYIEWLNRLWGALTGVIVLVCLILSFQFIRTQPSIFIYTLLGFVFVMVNALLGAVVVNSNLLSGIVTTHFLAAFASIVFFMVARSKLLKNPVQLKPTLSLKVTVVLAMVLVIAQIVAGTQIREVYEQVLALNPNMHSDPNFPNPLLGKSFPWHLYLGFATLLAVAIQFGQFLRWTKMVKYGAAILALTASQLVFGGLIVNNTIEPISKLFHISIGASIFVVQFYICTKIFRRQKSTNN